MPIEREQQMTAYNFSDFSGGMNTAQPPEQIADNEAELIMNYEYDYNRLRTRGGTSAPLVNVDDSIKSFYYDAATEAYLLFGAGTDKVKGNIYLAYIGEPATFVGQLTGNERPVCCKFDGCIYIASGDKLQYFDYEQLFTVESSKLCDNVFERLGRLVTTHRGDDNLYYSATGDAKSKDAWTDNSNDDSSSKWLEVGYKDDGDIITCKPMANDLLVFKTNGRIYSVSGEYPAWNVSQVGEKSYAEDIQKSIEIVGDSVAFITRNGIRSVDTVQTYGNFTMNEIGYKFNKSLTANISNPMCWNAVSKRQLIIRPSSSNKKLLFIYQYNMMAGYELEFPFDIDDMAETSNGIIILSGNALYRWSFEYSTDNGQPIKTKLVTRRLTTAVAFYTRKYDIQIEGDVSGVVNLTAGKQSWKHLLKKPRRLKYLYDTLNSLQLTLSSESQHTITTIVLYTVVK